MSKKMEKLDNNDPSMPKMLSGKNVSACMKTNLAIDMNDADDMEAKLLEMAHSLVVDSDDPDFQGMGRCLKPMVSGYAEALRIHNKSNLSNGTFVNALINFAGMALGMSINATCKPGFKVQMADEAVNGIAETIRHSLDNNSDVKKAPQNRTNEALDLLTRFITKKSQGKLDA